MTCPICNHPGSADAESCAYQYRHPKPSPLETCSHAVPSAEENRLRGLLDDANGKLHTLQSMMSEAGFPMRVKWGEDLHGNEDWVRVRPECQLRDVLRRLAELTNQRQPQENVKGQP